MIVIVDVDIIYLSLGMENTSTDIKEKWYVDMPVRKHFLSVTDYSEKNRDRLLVFLCRMVENESLKTNLLQVRTTQLPQQRSHPHSRTRVDLPRQDGAFPIPS